MTDKERLQAARRNVNALVRRLRRVVREVQKIQYGLQRVPMDFPASSPPRRRSARRRR